MPRSGPCGRLGGNVVAVAGGLCRLLDINFREFLFSRTPVNKPGQVSEPLESTTEVTEQPGRVVPQTPLKGTRQVAQEHRHGLWRRHIGG
jgi:hypothetical protein